MLLFLDRSVVAETKWMTPHIHNMTFKKLANNKSVFFLENRGNSQISVIIWKTVGRILAFPLKRTRWRLVLATCSQMRSWFWVNQDHPSLILTFSRLQLKCDYMVLRISSERRDEGYLENDYHYHTCSRNQSEALTTTELGSQRSKRSRQSTDPCKTGYSEP